MLCISRTRNNFESFKELLDANLKTVKDKFQEVHGKVNAYVPKKSPSKEE